MFDQSEKQTISHYYLHNVSVQICLAEGSCVQTQRMCYKKQKKNQLLILYLRIHILVMSNFQINIKCKHQAISVLEVNAEYYLFISKRGRVH